MFAFVASMLIRSILHVILYRLGFRLCKNAGKAGDTFDPEAIDLEAVRFCP
jgi:hypothetical protein